MVDKNEHTSKPLQRIPWNEKMARKGEWFENTAEYYLSRSNFGSVSGPNALPGRKDEILKLYRAYNNDLPTEWFSSVINPLKSKKKEYQNWPAKIRPTTILRTNIDLLLGEWPRRPFKYRVENVGEDGYNAFLDNLNKIIEKNLTDMFMAIAQQEMVASGATDEELSQLTPDQVPLPMEVKQKFQSTYKDKTAIKANKWMKRAMIEYEIKSKMHAMFKDWLIAGDASSYKAIHNGDLIYKRIGPIDIDAVTTEDSPYYEDAESVVARHRMTYSDIVDWFYDELDEDDHKKIEARTRHAGPRGFYSYLGGLSRGPVTTDILDVFHVVWKGKKRVDILTYMDPETGKMEQRELDESEEYKAQDGETIKTIWPNEYYETWKITDDLYVRKQAIPAQRNELNNISVCKGPYNGRKFSDTYADNISVLQIGIPFQIMYIIVTRALEMTIAKNKGKIVLLDQKTIPKTNGWDEEKFFYYAEALGYALIDRSQIGVDKSMNQYQVLDLTLFDQIKQLIDLQNHIKQQWDDVLGISPQRKAQTQASETLGANQDAIFRSTVITDMIFLGFDELVRKELQGILDLSKFVNIDGLRRLYNSDAMADELFEIDPESYAFAQLGLFMTQNAEDYQALETMKAQLPNMIQNGAAPSTVLEIVQAGNLAELKSILKSVEQIQMEQAQASAENEQKAQENMEELRKGFMEYEKMLEEQLMVTEYSLKQDLEITKGEVSLLTANGTTDVDNNGVPDANQIATNQIKREEIASDERKQQREILAKEREQKFDAFMKAAEIKSKERIADAKNKVDKIKAKASARSKAKK